MDSSSTTKDTPVIIKSKSEAISLLDRREWLFASEVLDLKGHYGDLQLYWLTAEQIKASDLDIEVDDNICSAGLIVLTIKVSQIFKRLQAQDSDRINAMRLADEKLSDFKVLVLSI